MKKGSIFQGNWLNIANMLSFLRLFFVPPFLYFGYLYYQDPRIELLALLVGLIVVASLTDFLDGFWARRLKQQTTLGLYLDSFSDKVTGLSAFSFLFFFFEFPLWAYLFYVIRELLWIFFGTYLYFKRNLRGEPNAWGKVGVSIAAFLTAWYLSCTWLETVLTVEHWLLDPMPLTYLWALIMSIGILKYAHTYGIVILKPMHEKGSPGKK